MINVSNKTKNKKNYNIENNNIVIHMCQINNRGDKIRYYSFKIAAKHNITII